MRVVNVDSGAVLLDIQPTGPGTYVSPDQFNFGGTELSVVTDQGLQDWRLADATLVKTFAAGVRTVSPYWTYLVVAAANGTTSVVWAALNETAATFQTGGYVGASFGAGERLFAAPLHVTHTHAVDYYSEHVWDLATGDLLRVLPASPGSGAPGTFALPGDGSQMLTLDSGTVDIWCH